jgi:hypothetical protein
MPDTKSQARAERLKAALKDNLKRRKAQARGRQLSGPAGKADSVESDPAERKTD